MSFARRMTDRAAVCITNSRKQILFVNEVYLEVLGWRMDDLIGRSWEMLLTPKEAEHAGRPFDDFLRHKRPYTIETNVLRCDAKSVAFDARYSVLKSSGHDDLILAEMFQVQVGRDASTATKLACAKFVQDTTYELAALAGRNKLDDVTEALITASSSAEKAARSLLKLPLLSDRPRD